eukprot:scaffold8232_cov31-Tisochrysis_lutea.AAC.4
MPASYSTVPLVPHDAPERPRPILQPQRHLSWALSSPVSDLFPWPPPIPTGPACDMLHSFTRVTRTHSSDHNLAWHTPNGEWNLAPRRLAPHTLMSRLT